MEIRPAVLVNSTLEFEKQITDNAKAFAAVDIDIQQTEFSGVETITVDEALGVLRKNSFSLQICWDLKVSKPKELIDKIEEYNNQNEVVVYQNADIDFLMSSESIGEKYILGLMASDELKEVDFYYRFSAVQIMTVDENKQGGGIKEVLLKRTTRLKEMGYKGKILIDGGVSLETADLIKKYPIDRVSVGSYFAKAIDDIYAKQRLSSSLLD